MIPWNRDNPPRLDRKGRENTLPKARVLAHFPGTDETRRAVATGVLLLWHDFWDAAHEIAQSNEGQEDHDLLHAILHRREGDFANAEYWLRRAGNHPCFDSIASRVTDLLAQGPLREKILADGKWNPAAFSAAVKRGGAGADEPLLRAVQAEEMIAFYEWLTGVR